MELLEKLSDFKNKVVCILKREKDEFKKMSAADKRVAIAKDVIAQINLETYKPQKGTYVDIHETDKANEIDNVDEKPADLMMSQGMVQCTVCAKGAMFMSHIRKDAGSCTIEEAQEGQDEDVIEDRLEDLFGEKQLDLIEAAFEKDDSFYSEVHEEDCFDDEYNPIDGNVAEKAQKWGRKYTTDQKRLVAIMRNIIKNEGTFKL